MSLRSRSQRPTGIELKCDRLLTSVEPVSFLDCNVRAIPLGHKGINETKKDAKKCNCVDYTNKIAPVKQQILGVLPI